MDAKERTRLRALMTAAGAWAPTVASEQFAVWIAGTGYGAARQEERLHVVDLSHDRAALIVAAVNALPGLLDADERAERAEARVRELEAIIARRTTPPTAEEAAAMKAAGLRLARRWHAVDKAGNVRPFPTAEVSRG